MERVWREVQQSASLHLLPGSRRRAPQKTEIWLRLYARTQHGLRTATCSCGRRLSLRFRFTPLPIAPLTTSSRKGVRPAGAFCSRPTPPLSSADIFPWTRGWGLRWHHAPPQRGGTHARHRRPPPTSLATRKTKGWRRGDPGSASVSAHLRSLRSRLPSHGHDDHPCPFPFSPLAHLLGNGVRNFCAPVATRTCRLPPLAPQPTRVGTIRTSTAPRLLLRVPAIELGGTSASLSLSIHHFLLSRVARKRRGRLLPAGERMPGNRCAANCDVLTSSTQRDIQSRPCNCHDDGCEEGWMKQR